MNLNMIFAIFIITGLKMASRFVRIFDRGLEKRIEEYELPDLTGGQKKLLKSFCPMSTETLFWGK